MPFVRDEVDIIYIYIYSNHSVRAVSIFCRYCIYICMVGAFHIKAS